MILVIDNYDSFTFTLVDYLVSLGAKVRVERNDALSVGQALECSGGVLISPGPGDPAQAGISVPLAAACISGHKPLLGICLGHQAIALACGSTVEPVYPMHGKIASVSHDGTGLFNALRSPFDATRYHSLAVTRTQPPLVANAWSADGTCMGLRHMEAPAHGVQFHPESIASAQGHALLEAFLRVCA